jgi:hypothetical protein
LDFDDLVRELAPPPNRVGKHSGEFEHHFYEGAVMVAYAMNLLRTENTKEVSIHPDDAHEKQFDFADWPGRHGFSMVSQTGTARFGGCYSHGNGTSIVVNPKSGVGDVVAKLDKGCVTGECKGGIINTRYADQVSRLYRGLCETTAYGDFVSQTTDCGSAVHGSNLEIGKAARTRCAEAGIEIALVKRPQPSY